MGKRKITLILVMTLASFAIAFLLHAVDEASSSATHPDKHPQGVLWFPLRLVELIRSGFRGQDTDTEKAETETQIETKEKVSNMQEELDRLKEESWRRGSIGSSQR